MSRKKVYDTPDGSAPPADDVSAPLSAPLSVINDAGRLVLPADLPRVPSLIRTYPTSLDMSSDVGKAMVVNASGPGLFSVDEADGQEFSLSAYLCHPAEAVDEETGEVRQYLRTVLFNERGETLVSASEVIPHRLALILQLYGPGPWRPPLLVRVFGVRARRSGRRYHDLNIIVRQS